MGRTNVMEAGRGLRRGRPVLRVIREDEDIPKPMLAAEHRRARRELLSGLLRDGLTPAEAAEMADRVVKNGRPVRRRGWSR